jgi:hypothetical protein
VADMFSAAGMMGKRRSGPMAWLRRLIVLGLAVVQLILVARILIDLGVADPAIIAALVGWTVVEGLVMGVLARFSSV